MKTILRLLLSAILIGLLLVMVDLEELTRIFGRAKLSLLLIACLWAFMDRFIMIYRWALLLNTHGGQVPWLRIGQIHFMSSFLGNFVPFSIAPDVLRAYSVSQDTGNFIQPFSSTMIDRLLGLVSLSMIAFVTLWISKIMNPSFISSGMYFSVLGGSLALGIAVFLVSRKEVNWLVSRFHRLGWSIGLDKVLEMYTACLDYKNHKDTALKVLGFCFINHIGAILMTYVIALSLHVDVGIIYFFLFVPIVSFVSNLPASFNGLGVYEAGLVYLFSFVGVSIHEALAIALLYRVLFLISTLPGGLIYGLHGISMRRTPA